MCSYDICMFNNQTIGLGDAVGAIVTSTASVEVRAVDTQTYYTAVPTVSSEEFLRMPAPRSTV